MPRSAHTGRSDAELLDATRAGDTSAFSVLWERHSRAGLVAARHLGNPSNADDVVSEAYLRIMELTLDGRGPRGSFRPYLYRTIQSIAVDHWRRPEDAAENLDVIPDLTEAGPWEDGAFDRNAAARAFASLSERWQSVLWYTEVEGLPPREAAKLIGISPNGVSALAKRAREALQSAWVDEHINRELAEAACQSTLSHLQRYQRGKLTAALSREVEAHLDTCDACAGAAAELSGLNRQLALVLAGAVLGGGSVVTFLGGVGSTAPASATALVDGASGVAPIDPGSGSAVGSGSGSTAGSSSGAAAGSGSAAAGSGAAAAAAGAAGGVLGGVSGMVLAAAVAGALVIGGGAIWITNAVQSGSVSTEVAASAAEPAAPSDTAPNSNDSSKPTRDSATSKPVKTAQDQPATPAPVQPVEERQQSFPMRNSDDSESAGNSGSGSSSGSASANSNDASVTANASAAASAAASASGDAHGNADGSGSGAGATSASGSDARSTGNANGSGASASSTANASAASRSTADTRADADARADAGAEGTAEAQASATAAATSTAQTNAAADTSADTSADANGTGTSGSDGASADTAADSSGDAASDGAAVDGDADTGAGIDAEAGSVADTDSGASGDSEAGSDGDVDPGPEAGVSADSSVDAQGTSGASGGSNPGEEVVTPVVHSWSLCGTANTVYISGYSAQSGTVTAFQQIFLGLIVTYDHPATVTANSTWTVSAPLSPLYVPVNRATLKLFVQLSRDGAESSELVPIDLAQNEVETAPYCPVVN
ncbi:sigma-70 family RNA polymerase sigma factor [Leucobacter japonicus]|uniref:sigma-70 family RNA polymerase sigma factor n=1 Tax=Leucobacter japonicus TaxID=1461259 RepID=UPI0006A7E7AA|nr:sigma-70 family RNA polymerase sigma factor [Leucobacter japonicus]